MRYLFVTNSKISRGVCGLFCQNKQHNIKSCHVARHRVDGENLASQGLARRGGHTAYQLDSSLHCNSHSIFHQCWVCDTHTRRNPSSGAWRCAKRLSYPGPSPRRFPYFAPAVHTLHKRRWHPWC